MLRKNLGDGFEQFNFLLFEQKFEFIRDAHLGFSLGAVCDQGLDGFKLLIELGLLRLNGFEFFKPRFLGCDGGWLLCRQCHLWIYGFYCYRRDKFICN